MTFKREYNEAEEFYRHLPMAEKHTFKREHLAVPILIIALITLLLVLFYIAVVRYPYYQAQAAKNRIARITLAPPRGDILDRNGVPLAQNHSVYDCYFISSDDIETDVEDLTELGHFLGLTDSQLSTVIESRMQAASVRSMASELWAAKLGVLGAKSLLVKTDLNQVEVTAILERSEQFPRAFLEMAYRRSYPVGEICAHVVGYLGEISQSELSEREPLGYYIGDIVGKAGLEKQYDNSLRGQPGERLVQVDSRGRILGEAEMVPAVIPNNGAVVVHGDDVVVLDSGDVVDLTSGGIKFRISLSGVKLEIDESGAGIIVEDTGTGGTYGDWHVLRSQGEIASVDGRVVMRPSVIPPRGGAPLRTTIDLGIQRAANEILGNIVGGVVVMDPRNGEILAMVSKPGYDPNLFSRSGVDASGWQSIMEDEHFPLLNRPVQNAYIPGSSYKIITGLAAAENGLANQTWHCGGSLEVGNRVFRCWNLGGHGTVNFSQAIANSCDVAFYQMGETLGHDKIAEVSRLFGLGSPLGIDLPDERGGLIPDDAWKRSRFGDDERWFLGDTMNMVIGQGFVQVSVLQIARSTAVLANGGYLVPPHINLLLTPAPSMIDRVNVNASSIDAVRSGMRLCVTEGTGRSCSLGWIDIAGKTGTADDPPRPEPHSWFTCFGPYDNPLLVITIFCENAGHGDEKAAPLAARIWESDAVKNYLAGQGYQIQSP
ncbi:MAG: penicillin-binding protein 2 [bacterium]|nr:penicillin-binding protein 2 [bacterium]